MDLPGRDRGPVAVDVAGLGGMRHSGHHFQAGHRDLEGLVAGSLDDKRLTALGQHRRGRRGCGLGRQRSGVGGVGLRRLVRLVAISERHAPFARNTASSGPNARVQDETADHNLIIVVDPCLT